MEEQFGAVTLINKKNIFVWQKVFVEDWTSQVLHLGRIHAVGMGFGPQFKVVRDLVGEIQQRSINVCDTKILDSLQ